MNKLTKKSSSDAQSWMDSGLIEKPHKEVSFQNGVLVSCDSDDPDIRDWAISKGLS